VVIKPGVLIWPVFRSIFKKGANGGGSPDFCDRIQPRPKSQNLKGSKPSPTKAKEKFAR